MNKCANTRVQKPLIPTNDVHLLGSWHIPSYIFLLIYDDRCNPRNANQTYHKASPSSVVKVERLVPLKSMGRQNPRVSNDFFEIDIGAEINVRTTILVVLSRKGGGAYIPHRTAGIERTFLEVHVLS